MDLPEGFRLISVEHDYGCLGCQVLVAAAVSDLRAQEAKFVEVLLEYPDYSGKHHLASVFRAPYHPGDEEELLVPAEIKKKSTEIHRPPPPEERPPSGTEAAKAEDPEEELIYIVNDDGISTGPANEKAPGFFPSIDSTRTIVSHGNGITEPQYCEDNSCPCHRYVRIGGKYLAKPGACVCRCHSGRIFHVHSPCCLSFVGGKITDAGYESHLSYEREESNN